MTVFNDRGPPLFSIASDNSTVTHQRGVSVVGWATSANGEAWSYKGKLATPSGWAALLGDPTIATDPTNNTVVYIATLALSTAGWDAAFGPETNQVTSPVVPEPNGFCVARSTDGGSTFPAFGCVEYQPDVDKTALTVDGSGRIWVAMEDKLNVRVRIWRSQGNGTPSSPDWDVFDPVVPQCDADNDANCTDINIPAGFLGDLEPRFENDGTDPWLITVKDGPVPQLLMLSWDQASGFVDGYLDLSMNCGVPDVLSGPNINLVMGGHTFRNAFRFDVGVGKTNITREGALRVAYEVTQPVNQTRQIRVLELSADQPFPTLCAQVIGWQTDVLELAFHHFQASVSWQLRGAAAGGASNPEWWLGYITNAGVDDPNDKYARFSMVPMNMAPTPILFPQGSYTPTDYYACPRSNGYWGDYFGIAQLNTAGSSTLTGWRTVMTFSDSRPAPPCEANTVVGKPMQVASAFATLSQ